MTAVDQIVDDLDAHLVEALDPDFSIDPAHGAIAHPLDDAAADTAMRALAATESEMARWEDLARRRKAEIDEWLEDRLGSLVNRRTFWMRCLETYARANHELTGAKSVKLPSGTVQLRQVPPRIEAAGEPTDDVDAGFVRTTRAWDKQAIKQATAIGPLLEDHDTPDGFAVYAAVTPAGERLPGVVYLVRTEPTFDAKPNPIGGAR